MAVLIAHRPERYSEYFAFDLALAGHAHGGQWRLPVLLAQGVYAPHQGLFPQFTSGRFEFEPESTMTMIVSRGLALHTPFDLGWLRIPRIFNQPELVVIDLIPES
jgi:hypothetical protein